VLGLALTIKFKIQVQLLKSAIRELSRYVEYSFGCEAAVSLKQLLKAFVASDILQLIVQKTPLPENPDALLKTPYILFIPQP
jgi:hypothetical protein